MKLNFAKYQGAGNDFVLLDARRGLPVELSRDVVARLCDRRFGIGADGLMTLECDPLCADFYMRYFNCDGGESTMCGNGGRAIVRFADDLEMGGKVKNFRAIDGLHSASINGSGTITLQMIDVMEVDRDGDNLLVFSGSPHCVLIDKTYDVDLARSLRERYDCNVNFVEAVGVGELSIRTFERGVEDETFACGTGAVAAAIAYDFSVRGGRSSYVMHALGGELGVEWELVDGGYKNVMLTGGAERVFVGELQI